MKTEGRNDSGAAAVAQQSPAKSDNWQIGLMVACSAVLLVGSCFLRGILKRRLNAKSRAADAPYYDVDSLDYGFGTAGKQGEGASGGGGPRLYPERWLMLFLYSLNMATLSVLASTLPSSQLPAEHLYRVAAYPIVTLMSGTSC